MDIVEDLLSPVHVALSPNADERPDNEVSLIVIHSISLPAGHFGNDHVEKLFCNKLDINKHPDFADLVGLTVASHVFIRRDGSVIQFVPFNRRAWHAGISSFNGREQCNDFSVGIELEGTDRDNFRQAQYDSLALVCSLLLAHYNIASENIVGHSDVAPGRKTDPGPGFDWAMFRQMLARKTE